MLVPRSTPLSCLASAMLTATLCLLLGAGVRAHAQQAPVATKDDTALGIRLYKQGDAIAAIEALRRAVKLHKEDPNAWLYLGLALNRVGRIKDARQAFEKAVKLTPNSPEAHTGLAYTFLLTDKTREALREAEQAIALNPHSAVAHYIIGVVRLRGDEPATALSEAESALQIDPTFSPSLILKSQALLSLYVVEAFIIEQPPITDQVALQRRNSSRLKEAFESIEKYLQSNGETKDTKLWRDQLEALRPYAEYANKAGSERDIFSPREVTTKARILTKPEPQYTEEARMAGVQGTVVLRAIFAADGTLKGILLLRSLGHGLSEEAIRAARGIKFVPATRDGRPVSQFIQIEYNFSLY